VTLVTVGCVPKPAFRPTIFVGAYEFRNAGKRFGKRRYFITESNQEITRFNGGCAEANRHGCLSVTPDQLVRYEAAITKRPQEFIETVFSSRQAFSASLQASVFRAWSSTRSRT